MDNYTAWDKVPGHLKTKTQLRSIGLKPAQEQKPAAYFTSFIRGKTRPSYYDLYDMNAAIPRPQATEAQIKSLQKARDEWQRRRTCQRCGLISSRPLRNFPHCRWCYDHLQMVEWARTILNDNQAIILDTETTGLYGEPVEISIINMAGETVMDTLVKATVPIEPGAQAVHGITEQDLTDAPSFTDVYPELCTILERASKIVVYNAEFDFSIIERARKVHKLPLFSVSRLDDLWPYDIGEWRGLTCAMKKYAQWVGEWSDYHKNYRWQRLNGGHRALGDCLATLEVIKKMTQERKVEVMEIEDE